MKTFTIKYSVNSEFTSEFPYWATAYNGEENVDSACGETFKDAKERLVSRLKKIEAERNALVPESEEVSI